MYYLYFLIDEMNSLDLMDLIVLFFITLLIVSTSLADEIKWLTDAPSHIQTQLCTVVNVFEDGNNSCSQHLVQRVKFCLLC